MIKLGIVVKKTWLVFVCFSVCLSLQSLLRAETDPRLTPITASQFRKTALGTLISSSDHAKLIGRAYISRNSDKAYLLYVELARQNPKNSYAQLWAGLAALDLQLALMHPDQMALYERRLVLGTQPSNLFPEARLYLSKAYALAPKLALAQSRYGWFLWQYGNDMPEGLSLLQQAVEKAPQDAEMHCLLGAIYSNQSGNAYDLHKAEGELKKAVMLDPSYAQAHLLLSQVYNRLSSVPLSQKEEKTYQLLVPKQVD